MTETRYAFTDAAGVVTRVIVADKAFVDALPKLIADPKVNTEEFDYTHAYDVTDKDVRVGDVRDASGKFNTPPPVPPTPEELAALQAYEDEQAQHEADDARLLVLRAKVGPGKTGLSQAERDEFNLIVATRSL